MPKRQNLTVNNVFVLSLWLVLAVACGTAATATPMLAATPVAESTATPRAGFTPLPTPASTRPPATSPEQIPTISLQPTGTSIPAGTPGSTAVPTVPAGSIVLSAAEVRGLVAPGIKAAFDDLTSRLGQELDGVSILKAAHAIWSDASPGLSPTGIFVHPGLDSGYLVGTVSPGAGLRLPDYRLKRTAVLDS